MALSTNKPRGRNGGRHPKLYPNERRELGAYAYSLKYGAPFHSYELPSDADGGWPLSKAATEIVHSRAALLADREDGIFRLEYAKKAAVAAAKFASRVRQSDLRPRALRRIAPEGDWEARRPGPASPHWVAECVAWVEDQYGVTVGDNLVRTAELEHRQRVEEWERLSEI